MVSIFYINKLHSKTEVGSFCLENTPPNGRNKGELTDVKCSARGMVS